MSVRPRREDDSLSCSSEKPVDPAPSVTVVWWWCAEAGTPGGAGEPPPCAAPSRRELDCSFGGGLKLPKTATRSSRIARLAARIACERLSAGEPTMRET